MGYLCSPAGENTGIWMNLGYWKEPTVDYSEACKNLAALVGQEAALKASDEVLCVGALV